MPIHIYTERKFALEHSYKFYTAKAFRYEHERDSCYALSLTIVNGIFWQLMAEIQS